MPRASSPGGYFSGPRLRAPGYTPFINDVIPTGCNRITKAFVRCYAISSQELFASSCILGSPNSLLRAARKEWTTSSRSALKE